MSARQLAAAAAVALVALVALGAPARARGEAAPSASAEDRATFGLGVEAYEQGRFRAAEAHFRELLERGHRDRTVLFNFGDAAYRDGRFAVATWAFEWARRLAPGDDEVRENLELARARLVADEVPSDLSQSARALLDMLRLVPLPWLAAAFAVAWCAGWLLAGWRVLSRARWATGPAFGLLLLSGVLALPLGVRLGQERGPPEGLVVVPEVVVRSGPAETYAALFELHAGTILQALETRPGWLRVRVPHGPGGWVPEGALAEFGRPETVPVAGR